MLRSVNLSGPAGRLEALLNEGAADAPFAALVCHPHPLGGGTLHNKVVYHAMKVLNDPEWGLGWPVLRFNFRGVGLSQGVHDGEAESEDVLAAMEWLENEYKLPLVVAGFSFGAAMAVKACCGPGASQRNKNASSTEQDVAMESCGLPPIGQEQRRPAQRAPRWGTVSFPRVGESGGRLGSTSANAGALALLGLPTQADGRDFRYTFLKDCIIPKLFLSGDRDSFAPASHLEQVAAAAAESKRLVLIPGADHFFTGQLEPMQHALSTWLKEQLL
jgi:hypothetical protein